MSEQDWPAGLSEPMRSRWSPSVFDDTHELDDDQLETLLQAARWAPSAGNRQPWWLLVLPRGGAGHAVLVEHLSRGNAGWVPRASAVVVAAAQTAADPAAPDGKPVEQQLAAYDLGQAVAHLTLQAQAIGLASHQFAGFDRDAVAAALGVPAHVGVLSGVALGVRGDPAALSERDQEREQRPRTRRPLGTAAYADTWGTPWSGAGA